MERNDFDKVIERGGTASVKWDATEKVFGTKDILPMWVADMDFHPPEAVAEALKSKIDHGIFGYTFVPRSVTEAVQDWLGRRGGRGVGESSIVFKIGRAHP